MKLGLAKFVICTSTLAQGVNFPLKYLIVTSTRQGGEQILVRDFHNLMGRAGRAGMHTEGSVISRRPLFMTSGCRFAASGRGTAPSNSLTPETPSQPKAQSWRCLMDISSANRPSSKRFHRSGLSSPLPTPPGSTRLWPQRSQHNPS